MELNQEYYATKNKTTIGGLNLGYTAPLSEVVPKMNTNGLTRLDPSNIWALNHGCPFIGSGGAAKSLSGIYIPNSNETPEGGFASPIPETSMTGGRAVETTGDFQTYSAVRWVYKTVTTPGMHYKTLSSGADDQGIYNKVFFVSEICMKHLIAVPVFRKTTCIYPGTLSNTTVSYSDAHNNFIAETHTKVTEGTYEMYNLENVNFYYGEPGKRDKIRIEPLIESNYNNINYFAIPGTGANSGYMGVLYVVSTDIPQILIGESVTRHDSFGTYNKGSFGKMYEDVYVNVKGNPVLSYLVPLWLPPFYSRKLLTDAVSEQQKTDRYLSIIYDSEATSGILYYSDQSKTTYAAAFITPVGATLLLNSLGITWAEDETSAINYNPDAASAGAYSVHIGVMEPGGITLGEGLAGDDIKKASNFGICEITDTPYDGRIPDNPGQNVDPDTGDIPLNTPGVTPFNTFNHMYCMTQSEVNDFANKIWNADETLWEQIVNGLSLYGEMPINAIISLRMYPVDLLKLFDVASTSIMRIGKTAITLDSQTEFVTKQKTAVVNMGSCVFPARYNNFLDYEPYTKAMLYLPYCGTVDVATADVVGKTVQVYYIIDVMTGGCTAVVYFGGIPYFYKNGRVGVEIPITANADSAVTSDALSLVTGGASSLLAAATGNPVAAALSLPSMVNSGLQLAKDSRSSFQTTGTQTPTAAQWTPQNAYFIVQRSVPDEPAGYGHSVGYVTLEGGTLGSFTGYTVMSNPDLTGVDCTEGEKEMIRNLLESGIYC